MGFLHQAYVIKDAFLSTTNTGLTIASKRVVSTSELITDVKGKTYNEVYVYAVATAVHIPSIFFITALYDAGIGETYPIQIYLSEDSNENKLVVDKLEHSVPKSTANVSKLFENGKNYCVISYTNSGTAFNITTVRIAMDIYIKETTGPTFMIYSEPIDPITIGTGETVQIKIEV